MWREGLLARERETAYLGPLREVEGRERVVLPVQGFVVADLQAALRRKKGNVIRIRERERENACL